MNEQSVYVESWREEIALLSAAASKREGKDYLQKTCAWLSTGRGDGLAFASDRIVDYTAFASVAERKAGVGVVGER